MDKNSFADTLKAADKLKNSFKCLACKSIPQEPYFTGVCDHLFCKKCIEKSNSCQICQAGFYQKELHLNKMVKEAILYVNSIVQLVNEDDNDTNNKNRDDNDDDYILPDFDLDYKPQTSGSSTNENKTRSASTMAEKINKNKNEEADIPFRVPESPKLKEVLENQQKQKPTITSNSHNNIRTQSASNNAQKENKKTNSFKNKEPSLAIKMDDMNHQQESQFPTTQSSNKKPKKNNKGETPLHLAVMNKDLNAIRQLLSDPSTNVNVKDFAGWTPLHEAVNHDHNLEIVKFLIENGANVNEFGYQKNTPLHEAALNKKYEYVKYLLENHANATLKNEFGMHAKDLVNNDIKFVNLFNKYPSANLNSSQTAAENTTTDQGESALSTSGRNEDFNITCTYRGRKSKVKAQKKMLIIGTSMNDKDKTRLNDLAAKLKVQVAKEMNNNGLEDSVAKGCLQEENDYEAAGSLKMPDSNGPFKGRVNASCQYPMLFEDCSIYLCGEFEVFEKDDMIKLVQMTGANLLKREPKLERLDELITKETPHHLDQEYDANFNCCTFILYDKNKIKDIRHNYLLTIKPNWLFSCIDQFKILHPDDTRFKI